MGEKKRRSPAQAVQDRLQRVYDRWGTKGLIVVGYATVAGAAGVLGFFLSLVGAGYMRLSFTQVLPYALGAAAGAAAGVVLSALVCLDVLRDWLSWSGDGRTAERAPEMWKRLIRGTRVLCLRTCVVLAVLCTAAMLPISYAAWDLPRGAFLPNALAFWALIAAGGVATMLVLEMLARPALADIATFLPADFEPQTSKLSLRAKALLPIPGIVLFTGPIVAGLVDTSRGYEARIVQSLLVTIAISLAAVAIGYVLAHALLDPLDELTEATRRVGAGDLDVQVSMLSADELGVLASSFNRMVEGLRERESLRSHNTQLAGALDESLAEVQASRARIVAAADDERRRMERDLHDGAQQRLVMISLKVAMAADLLEKDPSALRPLLEELRADASRAVEELRDLAHGIYPPLLESDGLASALEDVADQSTLPVEVNTDDAGRYPAAVEAAVYFCCIEALQNAAKHAGAGSRARILLEAEDGVLHFAVSDDGQGFDADHLNGSTGLQNMRDRIGALGGVLQVQSSPGAGTTIEGTVPV